METLPVEIIEKIFKNLRFSDLKQASQTCQHWHSVYQRSTFMGKICLHFKKEFNLEIINIFLNSCNLYQNVKFSSVQFYDVSKSKRSLCRRDVIYEHPDFIISLQDLFQKLSRTVQSLSFHKCHLERNRFYTFLHMFPSLFNLEIEECIFAGNKEGGELQLDKLKKFNFKYPDDEIQRFESGNIYSGLANINANLIKLKVQLYMNEADDDADGVVEDQLKCVIRAVQKHKHSLKSFKVDSFHDSALKRLIFDDDILKLEKLVVGELKIKNDENIFFNFIRQQKHIKKLELCIESKFDHNNDQHLKTICDELSCLEKFYYDASRNTDIGLENIQKLKKLKNLVLTKNRNHIPLSPYCFDNIYMENLKSLGVYYKELHLQAVLKITENFPNLMALNLSECEKGVTDESVQTIFKNLKMLESLDLSKCGKVTEYGFTGLQGQPAYHIKELTKLKDLVLEKCPGISDVSLDTFNNVNLKSLSLALCAKITYSGWGILCTKCPSITWLNLSICKNLDDEAVELITTQLTQLEVLNLYKNNMLTNSSVFSIARNCEYLEDLDLTKCRGIKLKKTEYFDDKINRINKNCLSYDLMSRKKQQDIKEITI